MFILDVAYSQQCVISIFISENNIWIALLVSRHRGPFIRRYKNETILYFEHVLHVRNIYNTSFWCCDRNVQMLGKKKTIITAIYSFVKNRQSAAVNVNRVLHVIVEHVRVGTGSVLALWSNQGWYLSYFAFFKQAGLIPELFCYYYNFHKYCKFTSTIYVCGSLSRN